MAYETLIAAYDEGSRASDAIRELRRMGVPAHEIKRHPVSATTVEEIAQAPMPETATGFWAWLFGSEEVEARLAVYRKALSAGGTVLTVRVLEEESVAVRQALDRSGPVGLDEAIIAP